MEFQMILPPPTRTLNASFNVMIKFGSWRLKIVYFSPCTAILVLAGDEVERKSEFKSD